MLRDKTNDRPCYLTGHYLVHRTQPQLESDYYVAIMKINMSY